MKPDSFECFDSASATECTGLFSRAPENHYEYDSYFDVMTFSPKDYETAPGEFQPAGHEPEEFMHRINSWQR